MKRFLIFISLFLLIPLPNASAANQIIITGKPVYEYGGKLLKNNLEADLAPTGAIGEKVFAIPPTPRNWVIDAAFVDEIVRYQKDENSDIALNWLDQLKRVAGNEPIFALAYGNPDLKILKKSAPNELAFYYDFGQASLAKFFGRAVYSSQIGGWDLGRAKINYQDIQDYNYERTQIALLSSVIPALELEVPRAKLARMLSLDLTAKDRIELNDSYQLGNEKVINKLRVVAGKYRLTSKKEKLPITLVNNFENPVTVNLVFEPLNARIKIPNYKSIELKPKSRVQIRVPVTNIAAGESSVIARFENQKGIPVGGTAVISINSTYISPAVAWFTTGAGILLLLAAIAQSVRRVRRNRLEK